MKQIQQEFKEVLDTAFRNHERKMLLYMANNVELYKGYARMIAPTHITSEDIFYRVSFAILSANAPFNDAVKALTAACEKPGELKWLDISHLAGMYGKKVDYVNEAWSTVKSEFNALATVEGLTWNGLRLNYQYMFKGLGLTKASFAVGLLWPLQADVACLDTWMQKIFLGHSEFKDLSLIKYLEVESRVRVYARKFGISTFLAQWMIWDHVRGYKSNHDIFPGAHK